MKCSTPNKAFSLAETLISVILVGGLLVVSLQMIGGTMVIRSRLNDRGRGQLLAQELMTEILRSAYLDPDGGEVFGLESGETGGVRASFDDVDDYHGWSASPPQYLDGSAKENAIGWERSVSVKYVKLSDLSKASVSETGVKQILITVTRDSKLVGTMIALRSQAGQWEVKP